MLIENILGFELNAPAMQLDWHIRLSCSHGIRNLKMGDATLNLHYKASKEIGGAAKVSIETDKDITVCLLINGKTEHLSIKAECLIASAMMVSRCEIAY